MREAYATSFEADVIEDPATSELKLQSYVMGGFECSTHRRSDGRRLDMIEATRHDTFARYDYQRLSRMGILSARDGLRWHSIEREPGRFCFDAVSEQIEAAQEYGIQVIWDLFHYGYPEHLDIFSDDFCIRFAEFAAAFGEHHLRQTGLPPWVVPVNEISFFSWIAGDAGLFYPFAVDRGAELKIQLARAALSGIHAIKEEAPGTRIATSEPAVYVTHRPEDADQAEHAESYRRSQFEALDMLTGRLHPELGGSPEMVDLIGLNFYPHNQWFYPDREMIPIGSSEYRPLNWILRDYYERYATPIFLSETGAEDDVRPFWFRYVAEQCAEARSMNVDLRGICVYPVVNHPGWDDERHCHNGLWDYADENGHREICSPLATEISRYLY